MSKKKAIPGSAPEIGSTTLRQARLGRLLEILEQQGISQSTAASSTGVPPQYLNDVKCGRRPLSERLARRLEDAFGFDHQWLLGICGSMEAPRRGRGAAAAAVDRVWLPVFAHPISGDPFLKADWDGSSVEIAGAAASRVLHAVRPYALRFGADDRRGRLQRGDLVLVSQASDADAAIQVIRVGRKCHLARRDDSNRWECLSPAAATSGEPAVIGHAIGILWGVL